MAIECLNAALKLEKVPNKLYIAHLELLLISEDAAKNNDIMDTMVFV